MRKYLKTDLCKIIEQLSSVNETLLTKGKNVSQVQVQGILTDCQQGAVDVGGKIEEVEGEGTEAVHLLEEYCEKIYLLCINWSDEKIREKELKNVRVLLNKVRNSILYDIKDSKKEVVFLPYKASMWDSLESVWKAADEDPECEAYVIPIPYYDKNPDGSFKEMHYEGDLYPKYVPITNWQEYNLEKRHPDVIFIHNPYDQYNFVTTVHPNFYASVLKKQTDKLVYIPYFVHQNDTVKEHYAVSMGTIWSDLVVLQSEKVREQYIKYYGAEMGSFQDLERKFVALGSPKMDVSELGNVWDEIPEEWKEKIGCENVKKKVIFFNTHLCNLMAAYSDKFFEKIEIIFQAFKENKNVVMLWRPHPLSLQTARSMNPEVEKRYISLVDRYQNEGWGIYDETPDLHRSIAISDAYYGNHSSVAELFKNVGKPVMILNLSVK